MLIPTMPNALVAIFALMFVHLDTLKWEWVNSSAAPRILTSTYNFKHYQEKNQRTLRKAGLQEFYYVQALM